jgi:hypothetical protein
MRNDLFTKTILTLIALLLAIIAVKPIIQPAPAQAKANLANVQFTGGTTLFVIDNTGRVWDYLPSKMGAEVRSANRL